MRLLYGGKFLEFPCRTILTKLQNNQSYGRSLQASLASPRWCIRRRLSAFWITYSINHSAYADSGDASRILGIIAACTTLTPTSLFQFLNILWRDKMFVIANTLLLKEATLFLPFLSIPLFFCLSQPLRRFLMHCSAFFSLLYSLVKRGVEYKIG
jgi:hypothetical protein